ncbi:MAG TPA: rod shape-determining protein RodA [Candidatus Paceibacterota bacterium]|nr:rod shape-determining protein RodA [Candidatus Paceibacterota bacterium]
MFEAILNERQARIDKLPLLAIAGLMFLGAAFIYSATSASEGDSMLSLLKQTWFRQVIWYVMGTGAAVGLCFIDYRIISRWSLVIYWFSILLLIVVLIPGIGSTHGWGARRWIDLGFFNLQPSEVAKLSVIFALASFLSRPMEELRFTGNFWKPIGMMALPFLLIMKEPDLGSAIVIFPTGFMMMLCAGTPRKYLIRLITAIGILATLFLVDVLFSPPGWWQIKLEEYQKQRLLVYFGADFAPKNASVEEKRKAQDTQRQKSYQVQQAMISVGSGGAWGKGWHQGTQTALKFLPPGAAHNDFIFSVIAEEEGFVGSMIVLTLYGVILFSGIRIAGQARDRLGKLLAVGVVTLLFSHVFVNIGMNIRIVPVTGIPLPLLSYGGSSVLSSLIAMGVLQNVYIYRKGY